MASSIIRPLVSSILLASLLCSILTLQSALGQGFSTLLNIPPDPNIGEGESIVLAELNLYDGGEIGDDVDVDQSVVNIFGGTVGAISEPYFKSTSTSSAAPSVTSYRRRRARRGLLAVQSVAISTIDASRLTSPHIRCRASPLRGYGRRYRQDES